MSSLLHQFKLEAISYEDEPSHKMIDNLLQKA